MMYKIPAELAPYLEYIPEDMLADIITDALRFVIFHKAEKAPETPQQIDMTQLLEQLKGLVGDTSTKEIKSVLKSTPRSEATVTPVMFTDDSPVDDDVKAKVNQAARNLFK